MKDDKRFSTIAVQAGEHKEYADHSVTFPIVQTSTFCFKDHRELARFHSGEAVREEYGRYGNPTQTAAQDKLAVLDGAERAHLFATGMNAITTTLFALTEAGSQIIITDDCYRRTREFCNTVLTRYGVQVATVAVGDLDAMEKAVTPRTRLIFSESPTNPYLKVMDLVRFAEIGRKHGVTTVIDSTFATPINQRPLEFGVDLVIHSATKYLAGHNDVLGGVICGAAEKVEPVTQLAGVLGGSPDPFACYLILRGLKTLALRVERQNDNALRLARMLEGHPKMRRVHYPGLESHPNHKIAAEQMRGFGGVVTIEVAGDLQATSEFIDRMKLPRMGPSLGGVESLVEQPALMSYYELTEEQRNAVGIGGNVVRYAVGIEDFESIAEDIEQALKDI